MYISGMADSLIKVKVELTEFKGEDCLMFTFTGHFSAQDAEYGIKEWRDYFESVKGDKVIIIWDSRQMTGFDIKAQTMWQHAIKEFKDRIECVWLVTDSKIIKAGAKVMSAFTSFCLKVVKDEDKILLK